MLSIHMNRFIKIGQAAKILGITVQALRPWEKSQELWPDKISEGKTRYYLIDKLFGMKKQESDLTFAYARLSSHDQKKDLRDPKLIYSPLIARDKAGILQWSKISDREWTIRKRDSRNCSIWFWAKKSSVLWSHIKTACSVSEQSGSLPCVKPIL